MYAFLWFNGEVNLVYRTQNLVNFANGSLPLCQFPTHTPRSSISHLVLEVDGGVEKWNFRVDRLADHFTLASVHECAHFCPKSALSSVADSLQAYLTLAQVVHSSVVESHLVRQILISSVTAILRRELFLNLTSTTSKTRSASTSTSSSTTS